MESLSEYGSRVVGAVKSKPYTFGFLAWQIGIFVAPVATTVASLVYTGCHLAWKSTQEHNAEIEKAVLARQQEKAHVS